MIQPYCPFTGNQGVATSIPGIRHRRKSSATRRPFGVLPFRAPQATEALTSLPNRSTLRDRSVRFRRGLPMSRSYLVTGFALIALWATGAAALTPAEKCEAAKLKDGGQVRLLPAEGGSEGGEDRRARRTTQVRRQVRPKWRSAESRRGRHVPVEGDQAAIQAFITQHTDDLAAALAGGPLPDCPGDLATCNGDLTTCNGNLGTCSGSLTTCNASLGTCTSDLGTCNGDLATCTVT